MKKATVVFVLVGVLVFAGVLVATQSQEAHFAGGGFGGGGGDAFSIETPSNNHQSCGAFCGWLIGKILDYMSEHWNDPAPCPVAGPVGGGGGDAW